MKIKGGILQYPSFQAAVLVILFVAAYWIPLKGIVNVWATNEDYSYGFLIPLISLYLFWEKRDELKKINFNSSWMVLPILVLFVLISLYGILGSSGNVSNISIPILIMLFVGFCFGIDTSRKFFLPLAFFVFMIPLPPVIDRTIGVFLKSVSSELGGLFIRAFGYSVHVTGNIIDLGVTQLQVVDACSGLRFIFPLFALGIIYSYFFERSSWKRIFCVISTIPIAILTNVLRIGITGVLTNIYGSKVADGFFHGFSGWAIFMVAFIFIFLVGRLLRLFPPKGNPLKLIRKKGSPETSLIGPTKSRNLSAFLISIIILLVVCGLTITTKAMPPVEISGGLSRFPLTFSGWEGKTQFIDPEITIASGAEEAFSANYSNSGNEIVSFYMGYRSTAFLENENFFHSPTVCLPSSGWKTVKNTTHIITDLPFYETIKVTEMVIEQFGARQLVYFWFQTKDKATYNKNINRFHLALHAIKRDNTHDLFIRPMTMINPDEGIENAEVRMDGFVRDMMKTLLQFLAENQTKI